MQRHFSSHPQWNHQSGWKNVLNNFRLIIQPIILLPNWDDMLRVAQILKNISRIGST